MATASHKAAITESLGIMLFPDLGPALGAARENLHFNVALDINKARKKSGDNAGIRCITDHHTSILNSMVVELR